VGFDAKRTIGSNSPAGRGGDEMRVVMMPKDHRPYMIFESRKPSGRKPSSSQQRILDQMKPGIWYEPEWQGPDGKCKDRLESCNALVGLGRCIMARIAKEGPGGKLFEQSPEDMLLEAVFGRDIPKQPFVMTSFKFFFFSSARQA